MKIAIDQKECTLVCLLTYQKCYRAVEGNQMVSTLGGKNPNILDIIKQKWSLRRSSHNVIIKCLIMWPLYLFFHVLGRVKFTQNILYLHSMLIALLYNCWSYLKDHHGMKVHALGDQYQLLLNLPQRIKIYILPDNGHI